MPPPAESQGFSKPGSKGELSALPPGDPEAGAGGGGEYKEHPRGDQLLSRGERTGNSTFPASPCASPGAAERELGDGPGVAGCWGRVRGRPRGSADQAGCWGGMLAGGGGGEGVGAELKSPVLVGASVPKALSAPRERRAPQRQGRAPGERQRGSDPQGLAVGAGGRSSRASFFPTPPISPATLNLASRTRWGPAGGPGIPASDTQSRRAALPGQCGAQARSVRRAAASITLTRPPRARDYKREDLIVVLCSGDTIVCRFPVPAACPLSSALEPSGAARVPTAFPRRPEITSSGSPLPEHQSTKACRKPGAGAWSRRGQNPLLTTTGFFAAPAGRRPGRATGMASHRASRVLPRLSALKLCRAGRAWIASQKSGSQSPAAPGHAGEGGHGSSSPICLPSPRKSRDEKSKASRKPLGCLLLSCGICGWL